MSVGAKKSQAVRADFTVDEEKDIPIPAAQKCCFF
jgi:hypothetical protein